MTFKIGSIYLPYCNKPYNNTINNERAVEVSLGEHFLNKIEDVCEIGAVMPYYGRNAHVVYDISDPYPYE